MPSTNTPKTQQPKAPTGILTCGSVMDELFERASETMSTEDLKWFAAAVDHANFMTRNLADVVHGIAGLIACDENAGNLQEQQDIAQLLWFISGSLSDIDSLRTIGAHSKLKLLSPMLEGGAA